MNTFLSALQSKAVTPIQTATVKSAPIAEPKLEIRIELIPQRNRIDVFFSQIPPKNLRAALKIEGFRFNPDSKAWYHQDSENRREYLRSAFGAELDQYQGIPLSTLIDSPLNDPSISDVPPVQPLIELCEAPIEPELAKFRTQTNELLEQLNLDAADLMLAAIDCLHRQTFEGNTPKN